MLTTCSFRFAGAALAHLLLAFAVTGAHAQSGGTVPTTPPTNAVPDATALPKGVTAAKPMNCRAQGLRRSEQRLSYGGASPRSRQQLNDCSTLGARF